MKARKYTKRIEVWETKVVSDGYGGNTVTEHLINESWANITTVNSRNASRFKDLGIIDPTNTIVVQMRWRNDLTYNAINQFLVYGDYKYIIQNAPVNINFNGTEVEIIAVREMTESVDIFPT